MRDVAADCMYFYNNFDLRTLIKNGMQGVDYSNTEDVRARLKEIIDYLIIVIESNLYVLPNGKKNSMFGCVEPDAVYITCTQGRPTSKANLYTLPVQATRDESEAALAIKRLADSIANPSAFSVAKHSKQYWLSNEYKIPDMQYTTSLAVIEDLKVYLYEQFGIDD